MYNKECFFFQMFLINVGKKREKWTQAFNLGKKKNIEKKFLTHKLTKSRISQMSEAEL